MSKLETIVTADDVAERHVPEWTTFRDDIEDEPTSLRCHNEITGEIVGWVYRQDDGRIYKAAWRGEWNATFIDERSARLALEQKEYDRIAKMIDDARIAERKL